MLTKREAKEIVLTVWRYLAEHPEIAEKSDLPPEIYEKIWHLDGECPLCVVITYCSECPLRYCSSGSLYSRWCDADSEDERKEVAEEIVRLTEEWDVNDDT
jgi:hypothetical protein